MSEGKGFLPYYCFLLFRFVSTWDDQRERKDAGVRKGRRSRRETWKGFGGQDEGVVRTRRRGGRKTVS